MTPEQRKLVEDNVPLAKRYGAQLAARYAHIAPADEVHGEALLSLVRAALTYRPDKAQFSTWAHHIAWQDVANWVANQWSFVKKHGLREESKGLTRHPRMQFVARPGRGSSYRHLVSRVDRGPCDVDDRDQLDRLFAALTPTQREVIRLVHLEGVSQAEVAERLGCTRQNVNATIRTGIKRMREYARTGQIPPVKFSLSSWQAALARRGLSYAA